MSNPSFGWRDEPRRASGSSQSPTSSRNPPPAARPFEGYDRYVPQSPYADRYYPYDRDYGRPSSYTYAGNYSYGETWRTDSNYYHNYSSKWDQPRSPTSSLYSRGRKDSGSSSRGAAGDSSRLFEPSEAWKKNHSSSEIRSETHSSPRVPLRTDVSSRSPKRRRPSSLQRSHSRESSHSHRQNNSLGRRSISGSRSRHSSPGSSKASFSRSPSESPHRLSISKPTKPRTPSRDRSQSKRQSPSRRSQSRSIRSPVFIPQHTPPRGRSRDSRKTPSLSPGIRNRSRSNSIDSIASSRASPSSPPTLPSNNGAQVFQEVNGHLASRDITPVIPLPQSAEAVNIPLQEHALAKETTPALLEHMSSAEPEKQDQLDVGLQQRMISPSPKRATLNLSTLHPNTRSFNRSVAPIIKPPVPPEHENIAPIPLSPLQTAQKAKNAIVKRKSNLKPQSSEDADVTRLKSLNEALKVVVTARLLFDRQTVQERADPILKANTIVAEASHHHDRGSSNSSDKLMKEMYEGGRLDILRKQFIAIQPTLRDHVARRDAAQQQLTKKLSSEYLALRESWKAHCAELDKQLQPPRNAAVEALPTSSRTTRRSAAALGAMGDMARSDLEMEQILATLDAEGATDPNQLCLRNVATIPDMILSSSESTNYVLDDTNHFVPDPVEYYAPNTGITDWTADEKAIFADRYAAFPKQFGIIADSLPNKTAAQCVDFYYLHKKRILDFRKIIAKFAPHKRRRRRTGKQKGKGLLADIRQHDAAVGHGRSEAPDSQTSTTTPTAPPANRAKRAIKPRRAVTAGVDLAAVIEDSTTATPTPEPEKAPKRKRVSASDGTVGPSVPYLTLLPPKPVAPDSSHSEERRPPSVVAERSQLEDDGEQSSSERPVKRPRRGRQVKSVAIIESDDDDGETPYV